MGKYFALNQGFEQDVSNAISEHYLPIGNSSIIPKKPISYSLSILDKLDNLVGFYLINEKPLLNVSVMKYYLELKNNLCLG